MGNISGIQYLKLEGKNITGNEIVKHVTEQVVTYMNLPANERKNQKKQIGERTMYANRWLGIVPFALKTIWKKPE